MVNKNVFEICKDFVSGFCGEYLESDISKLKDFCFMDLKIEPEIPEIQKLNEESCNIIKIKDDDKKIYGLYFFKDGKPKYKHAYGFEDCDDMNLIRAIYFILYYDKVPENKVQDLWNSLNWVDDGNNTNIYRGETINTFNTLITDNKSHKMFYPVYFKDNCELVKKITKFRRKLFTLGNLMILPNLSINGNHTTLNTYKGCKMGDYFDAFLKHIKEQDDEYINELIEKNKEFFDFDFQNFVLKNHLDNYVDEQYNVIELHDYIRYWNITSKQKAYYKEVIEQYIDVVEDKINKRADVLLKELKEKLSEK